MTSFFVLGYIVGKNGVPSNSDSHFSLNAQSHGDVVDTVNQADWNLLLVNKWNAVDETYVPDVTLVDESHYVDSRIADSLTAMLKAAAKDSVIIYITSAYRDYERQTELYENKTKSYVEQGYSLEEAKKEAGKVVAVPGTSEHQLGLAVDLVSAEYTGLEKEQEQTLGFQWLKKHCAEYGFILRYPNNKTDITGIIYEPWHFRYVGEKIAKDIMEQGICLEEYLKQNQL